VLWLERLTDLGTIIALSAAVGVIGWCLAALTRLPPIPICLALGVALGPIGLDALPQDAIERRLPEVVPFAAALILFEGSSSLEVGALKGAHRVLGRLVAFGAIVSLVGGSLIGWLAGGLPFGVAVIFGALMIATGGAAVLPIVRRVPLAPQVRALLVGESVLVDPLGLLIAVFVTQLVVSNSGPSPRAVLQIGLQLGGGSLVGVVLGGIAGVVLRLRHFTREAGVATASLLAMGCALGAYAIGERLAKGAGIVAVTVGGVTIAALGSRALRTIRQFSSQLSQLCFAALLVMIAASFDPRPLLANPSAALIVIACVALVLRPLGVLLAAIGSELRVGERLLLGWVGPRGVVAAAMGALAAIELRARSVEGGARLEMLVLATVAATSLIQGATAGLAARILGARVDGARGLVIAGAHALARGIGRALREAAIPVTLIDSSTDRCRAADSEKIDVLQASAADAAAIANACEMHGSFLALTPYAELNALATLRAREALGSRWVYRAQVASDGAMQHDPDDRVALSQPIDVDAVCAMLESGQMLVRLEAPQREGPLDEVEKVDKMTVLMMVRGGRPLVPERHTPIRWEDRLVVLRDKGADAHGSKA
jgi:NhaP-type Na+/H+ or K+/H+ antiporter